jgi:hypothetical protein
VHGIEEERDGRLPGWRFDRVVVISANSSAVRPFDLQVACDRKVIRERIFRDLTSSRSHAFSEDVIERGIWILFAPTRLGWHLGDYCLLLPPDLVSIAKCRAEREGSAASRANAAWRDPRQGAGH